jgi:hypothetical protein
MTADVRNWVSISSFFGTQSLEARKCQYRNAPEMSPAFRPWPCQLFEIQVSENFFMSKLEVIAVAILASPVLLHLLKRFLPLKPEPKQSVINHFHAPVYQLNLPGELPAELVRLLIDKAEIQTATKTAIQDQSRSDLVISK